MSDDAERYGPQLDDELEEDLRAALREGLISAEELSEEELRALRAEGSKRKPPKPTGHVCSSCAPIVLPSPTGIPRLWHRSTCKERPNKPVLSGEYAKGRTWPS